MVLDRTIFLPLGCSAWRARKEAVMKTWGAKVPHIYWIEDDNGYENIPYRYINFFLGELDLSFDWYVFCDDDTYFFPTRLEALLNDYPDPGGIAYCIGAIIQLHNSDLRYPSGGAGFALSQVTVSAIREYLKCEQKPQIARNGDVSIGYWLRQAVDTQLIDRSDLFFGTLPQRLGHNVSHINRAVSYHHVGPDDALVLDEYDS